MKIQHSTAKFIFAVVILAPVFIWTQTDQADDTLPVAEHAPADMQVDEITHFKSSELCTGIDCPSGAYVVSGGNGEELFRISQVLKERGQVDQATGHWTNNRYAILIDTGQYTMPSSFELGYYTQVLGVGAHPDEVNVSPGIEVFNQCPAGVGTPSCKLIGGLNNFWRGIENLKMTITTADPLRLAISQATALRRLNVKGGELLLCDWNTPSDHYVCGYTSGGFMANSRIQKLTPGSQQQWLTRNAFLSESATAVWNAIFVGTTIENLLEPDPAAIHYGPENNKWENFPITMVPSTPIVREKPYLIKSKSNSSWQVIVPELKSGSSGPDWEYAPFKSLDISQFEVVASNPDSTGITTINSQKIAEINHELAQDNRHLLIMPGVYTLEGTLHVKHEDTVILGLGIPALVCAAGPCMSIDVERGVKLAGVTFDAGYGNTEYLLKVGNGSDRSNADNPHSLSDIYVRVAETQDANRDRGIRQTQTAVVINSNNVIGDNLWIWRGDHDKASGTDPDPSNNLVEWGENTALYGLIVYGKEVTMYGLAVEHFQDYQTLWYGNHGQVYFYQSEAPYDFGSPGSPAAWLCTDPLTDETTTAGDGCQAYVVSKEVTHHTALGVGVYSYFADDKIQLPSAIKAPTHEGIKIEHIISHWLNGVSGSSIRNLVQDYSGKQCWGYEATCLEVAQSLCIDADRKQTSVLGVFDRSTFALTQPCNVGAQHVAP